MLTISKLLFLGLLSLTCISQRALAYEINIKSLGAVGDGKKLNTTIIQKALDQASAAGGRVIVPAGTYLTGTLFIKSNTVLELDPKATLLGSTRLADYTAMTWGHHEDRTPWHLLVAKDAENITITGSGTIDGQGPAFWEKERKHDWAFYKEIEERPSPMVEIQNCKRVTISGIKMTNSAGWTLHLYDSEDVKATGLTIINSHFGPNADGIDVTGCSNVMIANNYIDTGDDAIALKTTEDSKECSYITVTNCVLFSSCVAFRVGYESRKDFRHITFSNCVVKSASRIVDIRSFEGAVIEHVNISNITGTTNSGWPINRVMEIALEKIDNAYPIAIKEHPNYGKDKPVSKIGAIRDISITNIDIETDGRIMFGAPKGSYIENVYLSNINLRYAMVDPPNPLSIKAASVSYFKTLPELRQAEAAICLAGIKGCVLRDLRITWPTYPVPSTWNLLKTEWVSISKEFYEGNLDKIRSGEKRQDFKVLWARDIVGGVIDVSTASSSATALPKTDLQNVTAKVIE